jgi:hypothetical protein
MDERSQHGYPQQHQLPQEHGHAMPQAAAATPWPSYAPPRADAPIAGHAPYPGPAPQQQPAQYAPQPQQFAQSQQPNLPSMQQFQYAANGYVLPGAGQAHGAPMSAHGGTIGVAQPQQQPGMAGHGMPMPPQAQPMHQHAAPQSMPMHGGAMPMPAPMPMHGGAMPAHGGAAPAAMLDANGKPQAWAFPTPNGLQLVQPGASSMAHGSGAHAMAAPGAPMARRMRWETIVPVLAVICLIAAIGLFMHDFDRITGRDAGSTAPSAETTKQVDADDAAAPKADTPDVQATIDQATALFEQGKFDESANLLHAVLEGDSPDPAAVALHEKVDAANAREDALLTRLATERRGKRWSAVVTTIGQVEQLRPLDRQLVSLRTRARAAIKQAAARAKAKAAAERAAAKQRNSGPSTNGGGSGGGANHAGHANPPAAGGGAGANTGARPPAEVPKGSIPSVPNVPNPSGAGGGVVGGGQAAETMCAARAPRHGGEDHSHTC